VEEEEDGIHFAIVGKQWTLTYHLSIGV